MASSQAPRPPADASLGSEAPSQTVSIAFAGILLIAGGLVAIHYVDPATSSWASNGAIPVVAAENFWGSLVTQLGGTHVRVLSIVSDPNADPHQYETSIANAIAVTDARLVIENGAGYDNWCQQLVTAASSPGQLVLNVATIVGRAEGDNPHFWYGQAYVNETLAAMYSDLVRIAPQDTTYFQHQYSALNGSLGPVWAREAGIRAKFSGTQVASTESIFQYMADSTGLNLISPYAFMKAVAEGNDPPTWSVALFQSQLMSGNVSLLVYNQQTVTPLTENMKAIAAQHTIPLVGVTETIQPPDLPFEVWMEGELLTLQNALNQRALGR
jgi:zinc/manganese transport system substrate-binding protein